MFFEDGDYRLYRDLLSHETGRAQIEVWAGVLMPNRVHLVFVPGTATGVMRHAGAGYQIAINCAREQGLKLPGVTM